MVCEYTLSSKCVDDVAESIVGFFKNYSVNSNDVLRVRLSAEECLNRYLDEFGEGLPVLLRCEKRFSEIRISLSIQCESYNPLLGNDDNGLINKLMRDISVAPVWNYRGRKNVISFAIRQQKKIPTFLFYIFAAVFGIAGGLIAKNAAPDFGIKLAESFFMPVSNAIMGLINTLSVVMVFTSVVSGVCNIGDFQVFRKIGVKMISRFILILVCCAAFVTAISLLFFPVGSNASNSFDVSSLWQMIVDIVPTNVFTAFSSGNVLQIIFLAVLCGIVMLILIPKTTHMAEWIDNLNLIVLKMLQLSVVPMPIVVFINLFNICVTENIANYSQIYQYVLIMAICCAVMTVFSVGRVCIRQKMAPALLIKKLFPTYLITISTASSSAAYTTNVDTCENKLGIDRSICRIGIPLGQVVFKPCTVFQPICGCLCFAQLYGIQLSIPQLIMLVFTVLILAVAEPPVPSILVCCFTLLFTQIGVPLEALSIILALECILDRLGTSTNVLSLQTELVQFADSVSMLDKEKLHKEIS